MAFVDFTSVRGGSKSPIPKGQCYVWLTDKESRVTISAPDALNGLRTHNYARFCFDAATNTLGIKKAENAKSASKLGRNPHNNTISVNIPSTLRALLNELGIKTGRYYFLDNPKFGFYTVDLNTPVGAVPNA